MSFKEYLEEGAKELLAKEKAQHQKKTIEDEFISKELADKDIAVQSIRGTDVRVYGDKSTIEAATKIIKKLGYKHTVSIAPTKIGSSPSVTKPNSNWAGD